MQGTGAEGGSGSVHKDHCTPSDELYTHSDYRFEFVMSPVKVAQRCMRLQHIANVIVLTEHLSLDTVVHVCTCGGGSVVAQLVLLLSALFRFGLFYLH